MSRYHRLRIASRMSRTVVVLVAGLACGCAALNPETGGVPPAGAAGEDNPPDSVESPVDQHIKFMKRAAAAGGQDRLRMITELNRYSEESPLAARLQLGFLLTSPTESSANTREGERLLRETLAGHSDLHPALKDLIELRLQEVEVRQALRVELGEAKGKIADLLSIESSMEQKKNESQSRSR